jgi:signal transduction histidine kinase
MAPDEILLTISDHGKGLPAIPVSEQANGKGQARGKTGVGLAGMRERVLQLGGRFEIIANNPGTAIKAVFPLTVPD